MRKCSGAVVAAGLVVAAFGAMPGSASAQGTGSIACGGIYTVVAGDTLSLIADRAYGATGSFRRIFDANRDLLRSPTFIEIGDQLYIPCLDGSGPATREAFLAGGGRVAPSASAQVTGVAAAPPAGSITLPEDAFAPLQVLEAVEPFAGPRLPEGGMITELIARALLRAPAPVSFDVRFEGGRAAWSEVLDPDEHFLGFPAVRPVCSRPGGISDTARSRCVEFTYSAPLFEYQVAGHVLSGGPFAGASQPADFAEARICRPVGLLIGDLEEDGLAGAPGDLRRPADTAACLRLLEAGEVDMVTAEAQEIDRAARELGLSARLSEVAGLSRTISIHAVAPRSDQQGAAFLALIDSGLAAMRQSGEWRTVIENHLSRSDGS